LVDRRKALLLAVVFTLATVNWLSDVSTLLPSSISQMLGLLAAVLGAVFIGHSAVKALREGIFGIDLLATVAILTSIWVGEYLAAAVVVLMLGGGELLEGFAYDRASRAIEKLVEGFPKNITVIRSGREVEVPVAEVRVGENVVVKPGGIIPVDGRVVRGKATVNQASVTGEPLPVDKLEGEEVLSGSIVELGALEVEATAVGNNSTYGRIITMVREAEENRAPIVGLADRFAGYYVPLILVIGLGVYFYTWEPLRMAAIFIIACPCALTLATPTAIVASIGNSARKGILIRNGESLEKLGGIDTLVMDKTGTITTGHPEVAKIKGFEVDDAEVLRMAAGAERHSEHPIAKAILKKAEEIGIEPQDCSDFEVYPGMGVCVTHEDVTILVGGEKLMRERAIPLGEEADATMKLEGIASSAVFVAKGGVLIGLVLISDNLRDGVKEALADAKKSGARRAVMLTGDRRGVAETIGKQAGFDEVAADLLPSEKVEHIRRLKAEGRKVLMMGDGINDAPALAEADVGVAMGLSGTDIAIETAGITLATNSLDRLPKLLRIGKETMKVIRLNIAFAMIVNFIGITLSVTGVVSPLVASVIHESNALIVMLNALRLLKVD